MESVSLDMDDLFEDGGGEEEELQMPAGLPDLDDDEAPMDPDGNTAEADDDAAVLANIKNLAKGAAKKKVQKPQPKLDAERLKSSKGLPGLTKLFENVKFKGKGHEAADLKLMMGRLEHWAHRLFPKMPFDEFVERLERLGNKRDVQNCVKRIRMDMPLLDEDFADGNQGNQDDTENNQENNKDFDDLDAEEAFEEMMRQEQERENPASGVNRRAREQDEEDEYDFFDGPPPSTMSQKTPGKQKDWQEHSTPSKSPRAALPVTPGLTPSGTPGPTLSETPGPTPSETPGPTLSETPGTAPSTPRSLSASQQERLERNKMAALAKRAARLGVPVSALMSPKTPVGASQPSQPSQPPTPAQQQVTSAVSQNSTTTTQGLTQGDPVTESHAQRLTDSQDLGQVSQGSQDVGQVSQGSQGDNEKDMQTAEELLMCLGDDDMETECVSSDKPTSGEKSAGTAVIDVAMTDDSEYSMEIPLQNGAKSVSHEEFSTEIPLQNGDKSASHKEESTEFSTKIPLQNGDKSASHKEESTEFST